MSETEIRAREYTPPTPTAASKPGLARHWIVLLWALFIAVSLLLLMAASRSVQIETNVAEAAITVSGGVKFRLGENFLLSRGEHDVRIEANGYKTIDQPLYVSAERNQVFRYDLERLPDIYRITSLPEDGVELLIDGRVIGNTPMEGLELRPGSYELSARHRWYHESRQTVTVEGGGNNKALSLTLEPAWGNLSLDSDPPGATISINGESVGVTPFSGRVREGDLDIRVKLDGYKEAALETQLSSGEDLKPDKLTLLPADGLIRVVTVPAGANIRVDGQYRGVAPVEIESTPGQSLSIEADLEGYAKTRQTVSVVSGEEQEIQLRLDRLRSSLTVIATPADAVIRVNGARAENGESVALGERIATIEVSREGYASQQKRIELKPDFPQSVRIALLTKAEQDQQLQTLQALNANGSHMIRIKPGAVTLGASRRAPGRRSNEVMRKARLTKPFQISRNEITNGQFRQFDASHKSGRIGTRSLDGEDQPVVRISWTQAAKYCNWLSEQEQLQAVYEFSGEELSAVNQNANGYRLPTEAEWAFAAKIREGKEMTFVWGQAFPPPPKSGNFGDATAGKFVGTAVPGYNDGVAVTASVGQFTPNHHGIHDLAGNVSEWVHDFYSVQGYPDNATVDDPWGPKAGNSHVIRGSSWRHGTLVELRASYRDNGASGKDDVGFRIARTIR